MDEKTSQLGVEAQALLAASPEKTVSLRLEQADSGAYQVAPEKPAATHELGYGEATQAKQRIMSALNAGAKNSFYDKVLRSMDDPMNTNGATTTAQTPSIWNTTALEKKFRSGSLHNAKVGIRSQSSVEIQMIKALNGTIVMLRNPKVSFREEILWTVPDGEDLGQVIAAVLTVAKFYGASDET